MGIFAGMELGLYSVCEYQSRLLLTAKHASFKEQSFSLAWKGALKVTSLTNGNNLYGLPYSMHSMKTKTLLTDPAEPEYIWFDGNNSDKSDTEQQE